MDAFNNRLNHLEMKLKRNQLSEYFKNKDYLKAANLIYRNKNLVKELGELNDPIGHELFRLGDLEGMKFLLKTNIDVLQVVNSR